MSVTMVDLSTPSALTPESLQALKNAGVHNLGLYLGRKTMGLEKGITPEIVSMVHAAGMSIAPIWELDPTTAAYFTTAQGSQDGAHIYQEALWLGIPTSVPVYLTVDFDAQSADLPAIRSYFQAAKDASVDQALGIYGGLTVTSDGEILAAGTWQTVAWSDGQVDRTADLYQYQTNQTIAGIQVDYDQVHNPLVLWKPGMTRPAAPALPPDVAAGTWDSTGVLFALQHHLMGTFADGEFKPGEAFTRGQAAVAFSQLYKLIQGGN